MRVVFIVLAIGTASQYGNGVAESVIHVRQTRHVSHPLPHTIPPVDGFIAVRDCQHIGEIWYLRPIGGEAESFWVIDCAGSQETRAWMDRGRIIGEVDASTARRWGTVGRGIKVERVIPIRRGVMRAEWMDYRDLTINN